MAVLQKDQGPLSAVRSKLRWTLLSADSVRATLSGLSPDTAAHILCQCVLEEYQLRKTKERRTLLVLVVVFVAWLLLNLSLNIILAIGIWFFLAGPVVLILAVWFSTRMEGPLRHNALTGLAGVIEEVRDRSNLELLSQTARTLDGKRRSWEKELEMAVNATLARLLARLSPAEATALPESTKAFLREALAKHRHPPLMVAALLVLGSAQDPLVRPLAEALLTLPPEDSLHEAARECLKELQ